MRYIYDKIIDLSHLKVAQKHILKSVKFGVVKFKKTNVGQQACCDLIFLMFDFI